jgi:TPR repeat protein
MSVAQLNDGDCLEETRGVPRDVIDAAIYFKMVADQNIALAQNNYN